MRIGTALVAGAVALATVVLGGEAEAHASLVMASPPAGASAASPHEVALVFSERLEAAFSTLEVRAPDGKRVDGSDVRVDRDDPKCLRVSLPSLPSGDYRVIWKAVSVDMHVKTGDFVFHIAP
jgi:methionine-rich copper-binding protein CopC